MKPTTTILCASLAALAAVPAAAQAATFRLGVSANVTAPMNDMGNKSAAGFGLAGFTEMRLTDNMAMRLRYEYTKLGGQEEALNLILAGTVAAITNSYSSSLQVAMADYVFGRKDNGLYYFVGVGTTWWGVSVDKVASDISDLPQQLAQSGLGESGTFSGSAGIGYSLTTNIGVEGRYTKINSRAATNANQAFVQASFLIRF